MVGSSLKVGDLVALKSGGPLMTVTSGRDDGLIPCEWFSDERLLRDAFDRENLVTLDEITSGQTGLAEMGTMQ